MERFFKPPNLQTKIDISEPDIILSKSEEINREKLALELAEIIIKKNPKLSEIKKLSKEFAREKRLNLDEIKSILRYSLSYFMNEEQTILTKACNSPKFITFRVKYFKLFSELDSLIHNNWQISLNNLYLCDLISFDFDIQELNILLFVIQGKFVKLLPKNYQHKDQIKYEIKNIFEVLIAEILFD